MERDGAHAGPGALPSCDVGVVLALSLVALSLVAVSLVALALITLRCAEDA